MKIFYFILLLIQFFFFISCTKNEKKKIEKLVNEWQGKEIFFPDSIIFTQMGKDTISYNFKDAEHKILVYVDSVGCTSCKLKLFRWKIFIHELDTLTHQNIPVLFFINPKEYKDVIEAVKSDHFYHPICIDMENNLNKLNNFPSNIAFQTFLLDKKNKVKIIGNPIHSEIIKNLYFKQIGETKPINKISNTEVWIENSIYNLGEIKTNKKQQIKLNLKNIGLFPLVIKDIITTCGCTVVKYDKQATNPKENTNITIEITPKEEGPLNETITIKCNSSSYPKIIIKGNITK